MKNCSVEFNKVVEDMMKEYKMSRKDVEVLAEKILNKKQVSARANNAIITNSVGNPSEIVDRVVNNSTVNVNEEPVVRLLLNTNTDRIVNGKIAPWNAIKDGIWTQRVSDKQAASMKSIGEVQYTSKNNFGNPFIVTKNMQNGEASVNYYNWIKNNVVPDGYNKKELNSKRNWIISNLDKVKSAEKIYYNGTARDNKISHATALIQLANERKTTQNNPSGSGSSAVRSVLQETGILYNNEKDYDVEFELNDKTITIFKNGNIKVTPEGWKFGLNINGKTGKNNNGTWELDIDNLYQEEVFQESDGWEKITLRTGVEGYKKDFKDKRFPNVDFFAFYNTEDKNFNVSEKITQSIFGNGYHYSKSTKDAYNVFIGNIKRYDMTEEKILELIEKGKETINEEAIITPVKAPGIAILINNVNNLLGTDFPVPYPHISMAVKGTKFGIAVPNKAALNNLEPEVLSTGSQGSTENANNLFDGTETQTIEDFKVDLAQEFDDKSGLVHMMENYLQSDADVDTGGISLQISPEFAAVQMKIIGDIENAFKAGATSNITVNAFETAIGDLRETAGSIDHMSDGTAGVNLRWNKHHGTARKSETFMHEIVHFMTNRAFGMNPNLPLVLGALKDKARESGITYEIFLIDMIKNEIEPTSNDIAIAKDKFDYVFSESADPEEFFAYAVTNEHVFNAIKDLKVSPKILDEIDIAKGERGIAIAMSKILNSIIRTINNTWSAVAGHGGKNGAELVLDTMTELSSLQALMDEEINVSPEVKKNITDSVDILNNKVAPWTQKLDKKLEAFTDTVVTSNKFKKLGDKLGETFIVGDVLSTHLIQSLTTNITQKTDNEKWAHLYELFRQGKNYTEKHRKGISDAVKRKVGQYFTGIDDGTRKAISSIMFKLDIPSLVDEDNGISLDMLSELLRNQDNADRQYDAYLNDLKRLYRSKNYTVENLYGNNIDNEFDGDIKQAIALSKTLLDGGIHIENQQLNADNIYNKFYMVNNNNIGVNSDRVISSKDKEIIAALNKFITIASIKEAPTVDKRIVFNYLQEKKNVKNITSMIAMYKTYVLDTVSDLEINNYNPTPKGYFEQNNEAKMTYELVPESELKYYIGRFGNMTEIEEYGTINGIKYFEVAGRDHAVGFQEGMFSISGNTVPGISLKSILSGQMILENNNKSKSNKISSSDIDTNVENILDKFIKSGGKDKTIVDGIDSQKFLPIYDAIGNIIDYKVNATTYKKIKHMGSNMDVVDSAAFTFSKMKHRQASLQHNKEVVDVLLKYHDKNLEDNNFIVLEKHEKGLFDYDTNGRWNMLPETTRNYIFEKTGSHKIAIPKDKMEMITGEKEVTLANLKIGPVDLKKHKRVQKIVRSFESYIQEIWGYIKETITVRLGAVVASNTISNMFQAWIYGGVNPIEYMKSGKRKWRELNQYRELVAELEDASVELAGEGENPSKSTLNKIRILSARIEKNSFHKLVQDGQFSPIVEDVNVESESGHLANMIEDAFNKNDFTKKIKPIKEFIFMDRNTKAYQAMLKITQYGDIVTREIIREKKEADAVKSGKPMNAKEKQELLNFLDLLFVNYGYTDNRYMTYIEKTFGVMFMKYLLRQGKAMHTVATKVPARLGAMLTAEAMTGIDITTADDNYWRFFDALKNRADIANPYEVLTEALSPKITDAIPAISDLYN